MIIRTSEETLVFITQPDHAHLARRPMEHCMALRAHPRHASILHAIGEHDNGWAEADAAPTTDPDTGQPLDFVNAPPEARQEVWPRGVARLARDPWAAALVATHAVTIYDRYRIDAAWAPFFAHMEALRDEMLSASGGSLDDLIADYPFVRLGAADRAAGRAARPRPLIDCRGWIDGRLPVWIFRKYPSGSIGWIAGFRRRCADGACQRSGCRWPSSSSGSAC
jgi:hypothetical protein